MLSPSQSDTSAVAVAANTEAVYSVSKLQSQQQKPTVWKISIQTVPFAPQRIERLSLHRNALGILA